MMMDSGSAAESLLHNSLLTTPQIRPTVLPFCQWNSFMCILTLPGSKNKQKTQNGKVTVPWNKYILKRERERLQS